MRNFENRGRSTCDDANQVKLGLSFQILELNHAELIEQETIISSLSKAISLMLFKRSIEKRFNYK